MKLCPAFLFLLFLINVGRADVVFCETGDQIHGRVLSLDETQVIIHSEIAGELKIPRAKVRSISFLKRGAPAKMDSTPPALPTVHKAPTQAVEPSQINPADIAKIQQEYLATATPEAQALFRETVQGLMSGKIKVDDLRSQAADALKQLNDLGSDLDDPEISGLLNSYGSILQNFLKQSAGSLPAIPSVSEPTPPSTTEEE